MIGDYKMNLEFKLGEALSFSTGKWKYYHYRSLNNFIFYLNDIKDKAKREKIYFIIDEYLDIIKGEPNPTRSAAVHFFEDYIRPVGRYYEDDVKFAPMISLWVTGFWMVLIFFIEYMFDLSFGIIFITALIILIYYLYILSKKLKKRVYGFMW